MTTAHTHDTHGIPLHDAAQSRELDRLAMTGGGLAGGELMRRAGTAAYRLMRLRWPRARRLLIVCGPGNNGGDGYVVGRLALADGLAVTLFALGDAGRLPDDARQAREQYFGAGGRADPLPAEDLPPADVIVDAVLGTGSDRELADTYLQAVITINRHPAPVLALDLPTGIHADSGRCLGAAVQADCTLSFISRKPGMYTGEGIDACGEGFFDDLDVPAPVLAGVEPVARLVTRAMCRQWLPPRRRNTHKGEQGSVLVAGGTDTMPGAAAMAAVAALRAGAGLVRVAGPAVDSLPDEVIRHRLSRARDLRGLLADADCVVAGPGLGAGPWGRGVLSALLESDRPLVVDADGLNLLAGEPARHTNWILTPHPGEAARLLGTTSREVQHDRLSAAREIVQRYGGVCVLKGAGTVITDGDGLYLCDRGHPGMATAGMGDVLAGVIGALLAQGAAPTAAAVTGVWMHAVAGERLAAAGRGVGMLATELSAAIPLVRSGLAAS